MILFIYFFSFFSLTGFTEVLRNSDPGLSKLKHYCLVLRISLYEHKQWQSYLIDHFMSLLSHDSWYTRTSSFPGLHSCCTCIPSYTLALFGAQSREITDFLCDLALFLSAVVNVPCELWLRRTEALVNRALLCGFASLCELSVFSCSVESSESAVPSELLPAALYKETVKQNLHFVFDDL